VRCSFCGFANTKVVDSRPADGGNSIRRRRECTACGKRFTTYEKVDEPPLVVVKKGGGREVFDRNKLLAGIIKACHKRPVSTADLEVLVEEIEKELRNKMDLEVRSSHIGELVMERLRQLDGVAYVRFASVYREFKDVESFAEEIKKLLAENLSRQ